MSRPVRGAVDTDLPARHLVLEEHIGRQAKVLVIRHTPTGPAPSGQPAAALVALRCIHSRQPNLEGGNLPVQQGEVDRVAVDDEDDSRRLAGPKHHRGLRPVIPKGAPPARMAPTVPTVPLSTISPPAASCEAKASPQQDDHEPEEHWQVSSSICHGSASLAQRGRFGLAAGRGDWLPLGLGPWAGRAPGVTAGGVTRCQWTLRWSF